MTKKELPEILNIHTYDRVGIFTVQAIDLRFSNGVERTYYRTRPSSGTGVIVMAIDKEDLIIINEYAGGVLDYELGFVRGGVDANEDILESANRELQEEAGFAANKLEYLGVVNNNTGYHDSKVHFVIATDLYPSYLEGDEPEDLEVIRWPLEKIDDLLKEPKFTDSRNLLGVYMLKDYLNKK